MGTVAPIKKEIILSGVPASPGIAVGTAYLYTKEIPRVEERALDGENFEPEIERMKTAIQKSAKELNKILAFARQKVGDAKAKIFEAQIMILEDAVLLDSLTKRVRTE